MKATNRFFALVLAVIMMIGVLPSGVFAAGTGSTPIVLIAGSDFQDPDDGKDATAPASSANVSAILNQIKKDYPNADGLMFCGDYDKDLPASNVGTSITALKNTFAAVFGSGKDYYLVQGNHDQVTQGSNGLTGPGAHDADGYGVFIIDEDDYQWGSGASESKIKTTASNLNAYLDNKAEKGYNKPIFVLSHVPLHFSPRTQEGDAKYASYIFNVLQEAGEEGLTVFFLYGHDHSQGWDNYLGGSAVYLPVGKNINICNSSTGKSYETYELKFTYMNAGFVGYYADWEPDTDAKKTNSGVDKAITMTVFEISDTEVTVSRYDENGIHNLKSAGKENVQHPDRTQCPLMTEVIQSGATVALKAAEDTGDDVLEKKYTVDATGVIIDYTLPAGTTAKDPVIVKDTSVKPNGDFFDAFVNYDITISGFRNGTDKATVKLPISSGWTATRTKAYYNDKNVLKPLDTNIEVIGGKSYAVFTTDHFSTYTLAESKTVEINSWKLVEIPGETTYTYTLDTDGIDSGAKYIIVGGSSDYVFTVTGGSSNNGSSVTISNNTITLGSNAYEWTVTYLPAEKTYSYSGVTPNRSSVLNTNTDSWTATSYYVEVDGNYYPMYAKRSGWNNSYNYSYGYSTTNSGSNVTSWKNDNSKRSDRSISYTIYSRSETNVAAGYTLVQNGQYLYYNGSTNNPAPMAIRTNAYRWTISGSNGSYRIGEPGTNRTLRYNSGFGIGNNDGNRVRLFKQTGANTTTAETYYLGMDYAGKTSFSTSAYATEAALKEYVKDNLTVVKADDTDGKNITEITDYTLSGSVDPTTEGTGKTYTVKVGDTTVGEIKLDFKKKSVTSVELSDSEGSVIRDPKESFEKDTGATITVTYDDNSSETIVVTTDMLSGTGLDLKTVGDYAGLTVTYGDKTAAPFTLHVIPRPEEDDYPDYPNGGSVKVTKSGQGINFQNTGVAKIELTASGIPTPKGIDVIVMVDTSSSMEYGAKAQSSGSAAVGQQRIDYLRGSLTAMLEKFSAKNEDGSSPDVRLALADFNGYTMIDEDNDQVGNSKQGRENNASVFTGPNWGKVSEKHNIDVSAFEQVGNYDADQISTLVKRVKSQSGTNFDYAFDTIYRLAYDIQQKNKEDGAERELFVIFMSDGCPFQYNYFTTSSSKTAWNSWLIGKKVKVTGNANAVSVSIGGDLTDLSNIVNSESQHQYFYNAATNNTHRMADAIKGSKTDTFEVISPDNTSFPGGTKVTGKDYMYTVNGLGATVYSIGFCLYDDNYIDSAIIETTISRTATDIDHFFKVQGNDEEDGDVQERLDNAFTQISQEIREAATEACFIDKMGPEFDLEVGALKTKGNGESVSFTEETPAIKAMTYHIYRKADVGETIGGHVVTEEDVGKRYGDPTVLETVTFKNNGTEAYSSLNPDVNILKNGIIEAEYFIYNNTDEDYQLDFDVDGDGNNDILPAESFCWKIGTIRNDEFVLSYYVYLTGSMEGERPSDSYETNESAVLYYTNWLDHEASLDTVSPILPWGQAIVRYAFYLVDEDGNVITDSASGATGTFANRIALTDPKTGAIINLNSIETSESGVLYANSLIAGDYELFDPTATFTVFPDSDGGGSWTITDNGKDSKGNSKVTTYVTDYFSNEYKNVGSEDEEGYDYTHTTVWFAVKLVGRTVPDTVVIDYGMDVSIQVLVNDLVKGYGSLAGIGVGEKPASGSALSDKAVKTLAMGENGLTYGTASIEGDNVVYSIETMNMKTPEKFWYAMKYMKDGTTTFYYDYVTVIPATLLYFEDDFVTFSDGDWGEVGDSLNENQDEDRPGILDYTFDVNIDANNIYGYDPANAGCAKTYSLGFARKATVSPTDNNGKYASFTFTGTAFDIISLTNKTTGTIFVDVFQGEVNPFNENGKYVLTDYYKTWIVDTYYGYTCEQDGFMLYHWTKGADNAWHAKTEIVDEFVNCDPIMEGDTEGETCEPNYVWTVNDTDESIYQIPVIKSPEMDYGTYTVVITVGYMSYFDHTGAGEYNFILDAIRIYNPAKNDTTAKEAYKADGEYDPDFLEIRDNLITNGFGSDGDVDGAVFLDGFGKVALDEDDFGSAYQYKNFGPNNEVYLMQNQLVVFGVETEKTVKRVHLGAKVLNGTATLKVNGNEIALTTATDMYYDITEYVDLVTTDEGTKIGPIVITNATANAIVSLTTLKITYEPEEEPVLAKAPARLYTSRPMLLAAVQAVENGYIDDIIVVPEPFAPEALNVILNKKSVKIGDTVRVTITTSSDVERLTLNGEELTAGKTNKKTGLTTWSGEVAVNSLNDLTFTVVAYGGEGTAKEGNETVKTVEAKKAGEKEAAKAAVATPAAVLAEIFG